MGKPKPEVCKLALKWFDTKKAMLCFERGRNVSAASASKPMPVIAQPLTNPGVTDSPSPPSGSVLLHPSQTDVASPASQACAML